MMEKSNIEPVPVSISKDDFKKAGHWLVDTLADFYAAIEERPVTRGESPGQVQQVLGNTSLPEKGEPVFDILSGASHLLINHSLFNGHPKFFGYITSSPTQIGALADMLAAAINPNVGANILSPMATAIEKQTLQWLAELIGVDPRYGGVLVSGGNMANLTAFLAARNAKAPAEMKEDGLFAVKNELVFYCSKATHTWIDKAATLFGHGKNAIRWVSVDEHNKMDTQVLERTIREDLDNGKQPFLVVGNAGDVSTGAVDNLDEIASICKEHNLWFHIDGAYGVPAAVVPECKPLFNGITQADSIALDPHKWLYAPLEAGCVLVKKTEHLQAAFSAHPSYYNFDQLAEEPSLNYYEYGLQNSRGFRALKVWMALRQAGKMGYAEMIAKDIRLSKMMFEEARNHPELEAVTQSLSITTLRYVPLMLEPGKEEYLNILNEKLLNTIQQSGEVFLSNAVIGNKYCLRACIVNYRTSEIDIKEVIEIIVREGQKLHGVLSNSK